MGAYLGRVRSKQLHVVYLGGLGSYALSLTIIGFFNVWLRHLTPTPLSLGVGTEILRDYSI